LVQSQFRMVDTPTLLFLPKSRSILSRANLTPTYPCSAYSVLQLIVAVLSTRHPMLATIMPHAATTPPCHRPLPKWRGHHRHYTTVSIFKRSTSPTFTAHSCWGPSVVRGPVDSRFLVWWVIDNVVWTDSWLSIAGAGCGLTGVGACKEQAQKVITGEAFVWGTRWPAGSSAGRMVAWTARWSHGRFLGWAWKPGSSRDYVRAESWVAIGGGYTE
jgi:hypothetical protein